MTQVWEIELSHSQQSVLLAMADVANDDGDNCYPSHPYLAWKTGYSERQVARIIQQLIDSRIVKVVKLGTNIHAPHYRIYTRKGTQKKPYERVKVRSTNGWGDKLSPQTDLEGDDADLGATDGTFGATNATVGGDNLSPDPLIDPLRDPSEEKEEESNGAKAPALSFSNLKELAPIKAYHELHGSYPTLAQMKIIAESDPPIASWVRAIRAWAARGFKKTNIEGMIEWAFDPSRFEEKARANEPPYSQPTIYAQPSLLDSSRKVAAREQTNAARRALVGRLHAPAAETIAFWELVQRDVRFTQMPDNYRLIAEAAILTMDEETVTGGNPLGACVRVAVWDREIYRESLHPYRAKSVERAMSTLAQRPLRLVCEFWDEEGQVCPAGTRPPSPNEAAPEEPAP